MTAKEAAEAFDLDMSPANLEAGRCPWAVHGAIRERGPVVRHGRPGDVVTYAVTEYDDIVAGLQDSRFVKDSRFIAEMFAKAGVSPKASGFVLTGSASRHLLNTDQPDHTRLRRLVSRAFTPRRIEALRPRIQQIVDELLDDLEASAEQDLIDGFAFQLSITMICELLGVPSERRADFRTWSVAATSPANVPQSEAEDGARNLHAFLEDHIAAKRAEVQDLADPKNAPDVLSAMIVAHDAEDSLSDSELVGMAFLLLVAGHETTVGLIGAMAHGLWRRRDQRQLLLDNPTLIGAAVEEFLRYEGPVQRSTFRMAREDVEIAGVSIPAGSVVSFLIGSANHDPEKWDNPDEIDITREVDRHVAFGQGIHFCLGAPLARLEAQIAIGTLLERFPDYVVCVPEEQLSYQPTVIRALAELPVQLKGD